MKTIKYLFLLIITIGVAALIYFNQNYFLAKTALSVNLQDTVYSIPALPTIAYLGICFLFGLLYSSVNTLTTKLCMGKTIKEKEALIATLSNQIDELKNELNFFKNDPYIKKGVETKALTEQTGVNDAEEPVPVQDTDAPQDATAPEKEETETIEADIVEDSEAADETDESIKETGEDAAKEDTASDAHSEEGSSKADEEKPVLL